MDIVQIIQREPLRTELLVASEQVDRFYKEYGLAFSYDYVQFYDPVVMRNGNGKPPQLGGAAATRPKQSPNAVKVNRLVLAFLIFWFQNQNYEKGKAVQRSRSGSRSVERNPSNKNVKINIKYTRDRTWTVIQQLSSYLKKYRSRY
ncbi:unnamed protein product [Meloidogyne enterolobii]|uniref:Uncharacterized protein n=1 Tax=Meloidogyne enterolobii TaxID=390850 RepID=A0ACB0Y4F9_MELEN